jgi:hypothetical protein
MLTRREMLGKTLGTFIVSGLAFKISEAPLYKRVPKSPQKFLTMLHEPKSRLMNYSVILKTDIGEIVAPKIKDVIQINDSKNIGLKFQMNKLEIVEPITIFGQILIDDQKTLVSEGTYEQPISMTSGDILTTDHSISVGV